MKRGLTLIELIFVIVIIGILSAVLAPNFTRPTLTEAAHQLVSHIRYTQHLAMMDNKFDPNNQFWYRERWQLRFHETIDGEVIWSYSIFSDKPNYSGNPDLQRELARNPLNSGTLDINGRLAPGSGQYLTGGFAGGVLDLNDSRITKSMTLANKYGILDVNFLGGCGRNGTNRIAFDNIGRPIQANIRIMGAPYDTNNFIVENQCRIQLCLDNPCINNRERAITIAIEPETGYAHIL